MNSTHNQQVVIDFFIAALTQRGSRYVVLSRAIDGAIKQGLLKAGQFLPSERTLAHELNLSRSTLRKAFEPLLAQGLLEQRVGAGTFVGLGVSATEEPAHEDKPAKINTMRKSLTQLNGFSEDIKMRGMQPSSLIIAKKLISANTQLASTLGVIPGMMVASIARVRLADDAPVAYEEGFYTQTDLVDLYKDGRDSIYSLLAQKNRRPTQVQQTMQAILCPPEVATHLGLVHEDAVLYIERQGFDAQNNPVEFSRSYYRGDRYLFAITLNAAS